MKTKPKSKRALSSAYPLEMIYQIIVQNPGIVRSDLLTESRLLADDLDRHVDTLLESKKIKFRIQKKAAKGKGKPGPKERYYYPF